MNHKQLIAEIPSVKEKDYLVSVIGDSKDAFRKFFDMIFDEPDPIAWRAAWVVDGCDENNPSLTEKYLTKIIRELPSLKSEGARRSLMKLLCRHAIPENYRGILVDLCFQYLRSEIHTVAVKVYAMQIIFNLSQIYPELSHELITVIEDQFINNSAGFRAKGAKIIRQLQKD
ncbi:MAG TPA: hypothetical protein ENN61_02235 [Bacteroidaceae bacterium]|nr:hypothetical protein [Bacteroidaceae bacterium]